MRRRRLCADLATWHLHRRRLCHQQVDNRVFGTDEANEKIQIVSQLARLNAPFRLTATGPQVSVAEAASLFPLYLNYE